MFCTKAIVANGGGVFAGHYSKCLHVKIASLANVKSCITVGISVQKRPFCDSALRHMLLNSWETNFCCYAITTSEFLLCSGKISAVLLP